MSAKIISVIQDKGGAGKSTIARELITYFLKGDKTFHVVDMGAQLSIYKRAKQFKEPPFDGLVSPLITDNDDTFINSLEAYDSKDFILIDSNSNLSKYEKLMILGVSDLAIVPLIASNLDMDATKTFSKYLESARSGGCKVRGIINKKDRTLEYRDFRELCSDFFKIKCFNTELKLDVAYKRGEINHSPGEDIIKLGKEIDLLLWQ